MKYLDPEKVVHPLRDVLTRKDWNRIQEVIDGNLPQDSATVDELDAASDLLYDAIVAKMQTHEGVTTLQ